jgi:hypothetical protein
MTSGFTSYLPLTKLKWGSMLRMNKEYKRDGDQARIPQADAELRVQKPVDQKE